MSGTGERSAGNGSHKEDWRQKKKKNHEHVPCLTRILFFADMSNLTSGQLALIILAFGACKNPDVRFIHDHHLVEKLGEKFKEEIKNMGENQMFRDPGHPCLLLH